MVRHSGRSRQKAALLAMRDNGTCLEGDNADEKHRADSLLLLEHIEDLDRRVSELDADIQRIYRSRIWRTLVRIGGRCGCSTWQEIPGSRFYTKNKCITRTIRYGTTLRLRVGYSLECLVHRVLDLFWGIGDETVTPFLTF